MLYHYMFHDVVFICSMIMSILLSLSCHIFSLAHTIYLSPIFFHSLHYTPYIYSRTGTVLFAGPVHYAKGMFAGLVMDDPGHGKNSG